MAASNSKRHGAVVALPLTPQFPTMTAISWVGTGEKNIHKDLGLEMIQWCETPSPDMLDGKPGANVAGALVEGGAAANPASFQTIVGSAYGGEGRHDQDLNRPRAKVTKARGTISHRRKKKINAWPKLSDELVLHIFSYFNQTDLGRACRVCDSWRRLASDESLWRTMVIQNVSMAPELLFWAVCRNPRKLNILNCDFEDYEPLGPEYYHLPPPKRYAAPAKK